MNRSDFRIVHKSGYYELYLNDSFYASADTLREVDELIDEYYLEYVLKEFDLESTEKR